MSVPYRVGNELTRQELCPVVEISQPERRHSIQYEPPCGGNTRRRSWKIS
jgi:hypothetical protein